MTPFRCDPNAECADAVRLVYSEHITAFSDQTTTKYTNKYRIAIRMEPSREDLLSENEILKKRIEELERVHSIRQCKLSNEEIQRYGRHLILREFGVASQELVTQGKVLVVGAGGLGSPCLLYLAGSGVGHIGIVDSDKVEVSNLHRQVIHRTDSAEQGKNKAISAMEQCKHLNPHVNVKAFQVRFDSTNAIEIARNYDIIVDCSDNVSTRYLVNDVAMSLGKVLVSGSALRGEGQLAIYGFNNGPCYRCVFPTPPPAHAVTNCNDGGVLGPVPGIIGCFQAMEVLKILGRAGKPLSGQMLIMDALDMRIRVIRLRPRNDKCKGCGHGVGFNPSDDCFKPTQTCQVPITTSSDTISCTEYNDIMLRQTKHCLVDVREKVQFDIASFSNARNLPISRIKEHIDELKETSKESSIYLICRRGVFSKHVTELLRSNGISNAFNIKGGYEAWHREIDRTFPTY